MRNETYITKLDDLKRLNIPNFLIEKLNIKKNEFLEIESNKDMLIIKKLKFINEQDSFYGHICQVLSKELNKDIIITNNEKIISSYNKKINNKKISDNLEKSIERRESILEKYEKELIITSDYVYKGPYIIDTILFHNTPVGLLILLNESNLNKTDFKLIKIVNKTILKHLA